MKNKSNDWLNQIHGTDDYVFKAMKSLKKSLLPNMIQVLRDYTEGERITAHEDLDKEMGPTEISENKLKSYLLDTLSCVTVKRSSGGSYKELVNLETQNQDHAFIDLRFSIYGSYIASHHTPQGTKYEHIHPVFIIVLVKNKLSFLESGDYYKNVFVPTDSRSGACLRGQTVIIYELGKFNLTIDELETDLEKLLYTVKHFVRLTQEQRDRLKESGGVVAEYIETFEKAVKHPNFEEGYNSWRDLNRDTEAAIDFAAEKGIEKGIEEGIAKGREKGIEEGIYKAKVKIAINLLNKGYSVADVSQDTGLSKKKVSLLKKNL